MKLKKIASLMLAGVMAVSMLAGCKDNGNGGNGGEGEGENGGTVTGYSAVMADAVNSAVKDMDYVTFNDNSADETALKNSLNYLATGPIGDIVKNQKTPEQIQAGWGTNWKMMQESLVKDLKLDNGNMNEGDMNLYWFNGTATTGEHRVNRNVKCGVVYAVDGVVGANEAVKMVASSITDELAQLDETGTTGGLTFDYSYVVSVSVANKTVGDNTANFILVTVSRTATQN